MSSLKKKIVTGDRSVVILSFVEHVSIEQTPAELLLTWIAGQAQVSDAAHPLPGYPSDAKM